MSDITDIEYLIRLRAQIMDFDEDMGGWIPHSGGGLAEIIVGKHLILSFTLAADEDISGSEEASSSAPSTTPQYEYYIQGNHNNKVLLECKIKMDFMFVEVMPTLFHYSIDEAKPRGLMFQTITDMKNFINMDQIHVYPSGSAVTAGINPPIMKSPPLSPSHGILKKDRDAESTPTKKIKRRVLCRYCGKRFLQGADDGGECEFAPDRFRSCIDIVSCVICAKGMTYHCLSDEEGDFETEPCACTPVDGCAKRWLGLSLLSMCVPCLCCYLPLRCVHRAARAVHLIRVTHAPQLD